MPSMVVMPKPFSGPEPKANIAKPARNAVTLASRMVPEARS